MNVIRIDDSADFLEAPGTTSGTDFNTFEPWVMPTEDVAVHGLLIYANAGKASRARRLGLRWLQKFRRERGSMGPALVYSFETRNALARDFSFLEPGMPGVDYLQLPYVCQNIENRLTAIPSLTADQLGEFVRWHSGLQHDWHKSAHDLVGSLRNWPEQQALSKRLLAGWAISIRKYAQDQFWLLERLENMIGGSGSQVSTQKEIGPIIKTLEDNLCIRPGSDPGSEAELPEPPYQLPPRGFSTIAIADDQGYEPATIHDLKALGYVVQSPALTLEEASNLLNYWSPSVFLADLNFPSRACGIEIIRRALAAGCLVIAVSRAGVEAGELPEGVEDCCGALNFQNAARIHRLIWRRALSQGIASHE